MGWSCAVLPYAEWSVRLQLLFSRTFAASCQTVLLDVTMHRYYRNRCCNTGPEDLGLHGVCVQATKEFLELARGAAMTSSRQRRNSVPRSPARRSMVCRREAGLKSQARGSHKPEILVCATQASGTTPGFQQPENN